MNLSTKFEASIFNDYDDMKGDTKGQNGVVLGCYGSLKIAPFDTAHTSSD